MALTDMLRGRQVVLYLTNKSGGAVALGDVVVIDTGNDTAFTTTTTARTEISIGVAQEAIANNAAGRVLVSGYAGLVNVPASVTRGHYIETHTVAKQATGSATRRSGSFGQFATGGATPTAWLWGSSDPAGSTGGITRTTAGTTAAGASFKTLRGTYAFKFTMASAGGIESVTAFVKGDGTNRVGATGLLYSDTAGAPINLIGGSGPSSAESTNITTFGILNTTVRDLTLPIGKWVAAGDYWAAIEIQAGAASRIQLAFDAGGARTDKFQAINGDVARDSSITAFADLTAGDTLSMFVDIWR